MLRIVFMGSPEFAVPSLEALSDAGHEIALVVTNPDRRRSRGGGEDPTPVKKAALERNLPVFEVEDLSSDAFKSRIRDTEADLLVLVAFRVLPVDVLSQAHLGAVNLHASLLPRYRGAAPIHHAVLNGDKETGCTIFQLAQGVDTGAILAQITTPIGPEETTGDVYERLRFQGAELLVETIAAMERGKVTPVAQDDNAATRAPKVFSEDARIRLDRRAEEVHNQVRAMNPAPGAWVLYRGEKLLIRKATVHRSPEGSAAKSGIHIGELAGEQSRLLLGCAEGEAVELLNVQRPGKNVITGAEFLRSQQIGQGLVE